jgi:hypothetical protein
MSGAIPCGRCGLSCSDPAWFEFELLERMASDRIRELVTRWPDQAAIEVRRCTCGHVIARTLRSSAALPSIA